MITKTTAVTNGALADHGTEQLSEVKIGGVLTSGIDSELTQDSSNLVTSGGVYTPVSYVALPLLAYVLERFHWLEESFIAAVGYYPPGSANAMIGSVPKGFTLQYYTGFSNGDRNWFTHDKKNGTPTTITSALGWLDGATPFSYSLRTILRPDEDGEWGFRVKYGIVNDPPITLAAHVLVNGTVVVQSNVTGNSELNSESNWPAGTITLKKGVTYFLDFLHGQTTSGCVTKLEYKRPSVSWFSATLDDLRFVPY